MNKAIFKENIKRFWPISLAAFIAYFMCGPFLFLQHNSHSYGVLSSAISTSNIGYAFVTCAMTVAIGAAVYAYLFKVNSTVFMHSIPTSRWSLFTGGAASGLTLSFAPVLANALVLIILRYCTEPILFDEYYDIEVSKAWGLGGILCWMLVVWVEIFFIFAICTLSAVISGNSVINVLTSCALNLLTTLVILSAMAYGTCFIFGFTDPTMGEQLMCKLHPVLRYGICITLFGSDAFEVESLSILIYILVAAAIFAVSYWIYTKRPNEKAGDSYVFEVVDIIICVLMVYMGASCIGLILQDELKVWGFVIGGVFAFFVGQLIIQKSFRIFNRKLVVSLLASVIAMVLVIGGFAIDLFGIERRVPKAEDVDYVSIYDNGVYGGSYNVKELQNIQTVIDIQKEIIAEKKSIESLLKANEYDWENGVRCTGFNISYYLKNGKEIERYYSIPESLMIASDKFETLYKSNEIIKVFDHLVENAPGDAQITVYLEGEYWDNPSVKNPFEEKYGDAFDRKYNDYYGMSDLNEEEKSALMHALYNDIRRIGLMNVDPFDDINYFNVEIEFLYPLEGYEELAAGYNDAHNYFHDYWYTYNDKSIRNGVREVFSLVVMKEYTETLNVLDGILENHLSN